MHQPGVVVAAAAAAVVIVIVVHCCHRIMPSTHRRRRRDETRWRCVHEFATSSRRLLTDSIDNLETGQTDSIAV